MSLFGGIKKIIKPLVDVPRWVGYGHLAQITRSLVALGKKHFIPEKASRQETFPDALARLNLTEADLQQRKKEFTRLSFLWLGLFILTLGYALYLAWYSQWLGFFPALAISLVMIAQAFRYHFWLFQIKQRRLGCRFRDWFHSSFRRSNKQ